MEDKCPFCGSAWDSERNEYASGYPQEYDSREYRTHGCYETQIASIERLVRELGDVLGWRIKVKDIKEGNDADK